MPEWTDITDADDLPDNGRVCATVRGKALVVLRVEDAVYAIANTCPHAGRPLDQGEVRGLTITCPFHGYAYNLRNGKNLDHPEFEPPVPTYPARIENGKVQVAVLIEDDD